MNNNCKCNNCKSNQEPEIISEIELKPQKKKAPLKWYFYLLVIAAIVWYVNTQGGVKLPDNIKNTSDADSIKTSSEFIRIK
jgi:hypothetical protein